jgi:hypothetical protein
MVRADYIGKRIVAERDGWRLIWLVERVTPLGIIARLTSEQGFNGLGESRQITPLSWKRGDLELFTADEIEPLRGVA